NAGFGFDKSTAVPTQEGDFPIYHAPDFGNAQRSIKRQFVWRKAGHIHFDNQIRGWVARFQVNRLPSADARKTGDIEAGIGFKTPVAVLALEGGRTQITEAYSPLLRNALHQ